MIKQTILLTALLALAAVNGSAYADVFVIDFEQDAPGPVANGFMSADSPLVTFSDTSGSDLLVGDFGIQSIGQALAVGPDDNSILFMEFSLLADALSLDFGNDDPTLTEPGDFAQLTLFLDGSQIAQVDLEMNRDDAMNQTIAFSGQFFNSATLEFYVSSDGLTEIVDNITFNAIPGPGIAPLCALGLIGLSGGRRRA